MITLVFAMVFGLVSHVGTMAVVVQLVELIALHQSGGATEETKRKLTVSSAASAAVAIIFGLMYGYLVFYALGPSVIREASLDSSLVLNRLYRSGSVAIVAFGSSVLGILLLVNSVYSRKAMDGIQLRPLRKRKSFAAGVFFLYFGLLMSVVIPSGVLLPSLLQLQRSSLSPVSSTFVLPHGSHILSGEESKR